MKRSRSLPHYQRGELVSWELIEEAVRLLVEASSPTRVIVFGSYAKGTARKNSDVDLLVVLRESKSTRGDAVRLRNVVRPLRIPVDLLVTTEALVYEWGHVPGVVINDALTEGKVLYAAA